MTAPVNMVLLYCPAHHNYVVGFEEEGGYVRKATPSKCCASWTIERRWSMTKVELPQVAELQRQLDAARAEIAALRRGKHLERWRLEGRRWRRYKPGDETTIVAFVHNDREDGRFTWWANAAMGYTATADEAKLAADAALRDEGWWLEP